MCACCSCRVKDLYSNLDSAAADSLSGPGGAARLRAAGYPVAAVQAAAEGKISTWDLKLAGYTPAAADGNGSVGDKTLATELPAAVGPPKTPRFGVGGSANSSSNGTAAGIGIGGSSSGSGARMRDAGGNSTAGAAGTKADGQSQHAAGSVLKADGPWDVEYFRHQIKPLMHMQPARDLSDLLIGTKVRLLGCCRQRQVALCVALCILRAGTL